MDDNLVSLSKLQSHIQSMKFLSAFLKREQRDQLKKMEDQVKDMILQVTSFNDRFSHHGWCAYDSMSSSLIRNANAAFEQGGLAEAEQVLIRCVYQGNDGRIGLPWRNDGKWILNPWDIRGLYQ